MPTRATRSSPISASQSGSGLTYSVEIRDVRGRQFACDCVDFRINGLGTCKHVEAVLLHLEGRFKRLFRAAAQNGPNRLEVVPDTDPRHAAAPERSVLRCPRCCANGSMATGS